MSFVCDSKVLNACCFDFFFSFHGKPGLGRLVTVAIAGLDSGCSKVNCLWTSNRFFKQMSKVQHNEFCINLLRTCIYLLCQIIDEDYNN